MDKKLWNKLFRENTLVVEGRIKDEQHLLDLTKKYIRKNYKSEERKHLADVEESMAEMWNSGDIKTDRDLYDSIDYLMDDIGNVNYPI